MCLTVMNCSSHPRTFDVEIRFPVCRPVTYCNKGSYNKTRFQLLFFYQKVYNKTNFIKLFCRAVFYRFLDTYYNSLLNDLNEEILT